MAILDPMELLRKKMKWMGANAWWPYKTSKELYWNPYIPWVTNERQRNINRNTAVDKIQTWPCKTSKELYWAWPLTSKELYWADKPQTPDQTINWTNKSQPTFIDPAPDKLEWFKKQVKDMAWTWETWTWETTTEWDKKNRLQNMLSDFTSWMWAWDNWVFSWWTTTKKATTESPIVTTWEEDTTETTTDELPFTIENFESISIKDPQNLTDKEKEFLRKVKFKSEVLWQDINTIFWIKKDEETEPTIWEVTQEDLDKQQKEADEAIAKSKQTAQERITDQEAIINQKTQQRKQEIQDLWNKRMNVLNTWLSFSWFARSTYWMEKRDEIQNAINNQLALADAEAEQELELFKAVQNRLSEEEIASINERLQNTKNQLRQIELDNIKEIAQANEELWLRWQAALTNFLNSINLESMYTETWQPITESYWIDRELTKEKQSPYLLKSDWTVYVNNAWNPVEYTQELEKYNWIDIEKSIENKLLTDLNNKIIYDNSWRPIQYWADATWTIPKIQDIKDWNWNTYIYENWQLDRIIWIDWTVISWNDLNNVTVPKKVEEDKKRQQQIDHETSLRKEFIARPEVKKFNDIKDYYNRALVSYDITQNWDTPWVWDIWLLFNYMKMLDPTSVVNPWEQVAVTDTESKLWKVKLLYNSLIEWARFTQWQRDTIKKAIENVYKDNIKDLNKVKNDYKYNIDKYWLDEKSIFLWYLDNELANYNWLNTDIDIDNYINEQTWYWWWQTQTQTQTQTNFNFNNDTDISSYLDEPFNKADQTAPTKEQNNFSEDNLVTEFVPTSFKNWWINARMDKTAMEWLKTSLNEMKNLWLEVHINQSSWTYRSYEKQKELKETVKWRVAEPWKSKHNVGLAVDIYWGYKNWRLLPPTQKQVEIMKANWFIQPFPKDDAWHFEYVWK